MPSPPRALPLRHRSYGLMCHSRWALSCFGIQPRSKSPGRLYAVPAAHGSFPTLSLRIFPWMLDPVPRRFTVCSHLFLPRCHRPSPSKEWVGFPHFVPRITTSRRSVFRGCRYPWQSSPRLAARSRGPHDGAARLRPRRRGPRTFRAGLRRGPWSAARRAMLAGMSEAMAIRPGATPAAREAARKTGAARADARAIALAPVIAEIQASGITAPHAIAAALNKRGIRTARGHKFWMSSQVRCLLDRLDRLSVGDSEL